MDTRLNPSSSTQITTAQTTGPHSLPLDLIVGVIMMVAIRWMLVYDRGVKVYGFMGTLLGLYWLLRGNHQCGHVPALLMVVVMAEVVVIGSIVKLRTYITSLIITDHKQASALQWKCIYPIILLTLTTCSLMGLLSTILSQVYNQLLQFPQLPLMLTLITVAFIVVYIADKIFKKYWIKKGGNLREGSNMDMKNMNSTRRKIFHFVPAGLLPVLVGVDYQLFCLMVFGAFYLFWLGELVRYFGKLARKQHQPNSLLLQHQQKTPVGSLRRKMLSIILAFDKLNYQLADLPLIKWMQELNSERQPYFWFTHLSLILGLSLTYISYPPNPSLSHSSSIPTFIKQNMSIILIASDAMAAIMGRKYGKPSHRVPFTNNKTVEGYVGFVANMVGLLLLANFIGFYLGELDFVGIQYGGMLVTAGLCGLGELFSGDLDNVVVGFVYVAVDYVWGILT